MRADVVRSYPGSHHSPTARGAHAHDNAHQPLTERIVPTPSQDKENLKSGVPNRQGSPDDGQPTTPIEPPGKTQPEIPKVGTQDAPGG